MDRHLHFKDEKSDKFWKISVSDNSHIVTYGRAGTAGTSKTKMFEDDSSAQKDAERLIKSKLKKGYVDVEPMQSDAVQVESAPVYLKDKPVVDYVHGQPFDVLNMTPKISADIYGEQESWDDKLNEYLMVQDAAATTHFVAGIAGEAFETSNTNIILKSLVKRKKALPNLVSLFLNDISSEQCELSWIVEGDLTPVWEHFPNLREFRVRGYPGEMGEISMPKMEKFAIECSGLKKRNLKQLFDADMPNLTHLELWIGTKDYGGETDVGDWEPLLSGKLFPKLKYLGLQNCDYADELAQIVANAPILDRIETLDMSLGTMGDEGAVALYKSNKIRKLKYLDLQHHFMSDFMVGRFMGVNKPIPTPKTPNVEVKPHAAVSASVPEPAKRKGILSKLFGKMDAPLPQIVPDEKPPVQDSLELPEPDVDYAGIPLISAGEFGPTVDVRGQEDAYAYGDEEWRYVAHGE